MVDWWKKESLLKFQSPKSIFVLGSSNSGKTMYTKNILENADGMPSNIFYCYSIWQPIFDEMRSSISNLQFYQGFPSMDVLSEGGGGGFTRT